MSAGPQVHVLSANASLANANTDDSGRGDGGAAVVARVYVQQESVGLPSVNQSWCAVLVVISGANAPARVRVVLPAAQVPGYVSTAWTMLPFNSYSVMLHNATVTEPARPGSASKGGDSGTIPMGVVVLEDVLPANGVAHYRLSAGQRNNELGCARIR